MKCSYPGGVAPPAKTSVWQEAEGIVARYAITSGEHPAMVKEIMALVGRAEDAVRKREASIHEQPPHDATAAEIGRGIVGALVELRHAVDARASDVAGEIAHLSGQVATLAAVDAGDQETIAEIKESGRRRSGSSRAKPSGRARKSRSSARPPPNS